ncbi:hypothetical protein KY289_021591 [Solanum tuberosum]|nr:hypothetical protein KY289_021591 [Solanum tuberosum]
MSPDQITDKNSSEHSTPFTVINTRPVDVAKNKLGFINGSCPIPSHDSPLLIQWQRCNDMVIAWLLNSLSRDISESVIYSQTAVELWDELEARYGQTDGTKLFQLQREINNISQRASDIAGWAPQRYSGTQKSGNPHVYGENKNDQYCRYCKKTRHLMVYCHRLIGYPTHYKITKQKKKGPQQANVANAAMTTQTRVNKISADTLSTLVAGQGFSREQCNQLIHMFQTMHGSSEASNSGDNSKANPFGIHHACLVLRRSFLSKVTNSPWILDSGATQHLTYNKSLLHNLTTLPFPIYANLANSQQVKTFSMGSLV